MVSRDPYFPILLCLMSFTIIFYFWFTTYRENLNWKHIPDLKCVPNVEHVLENKNALTILTVLYKQFQFRSVLLLIIPTFLRTRSKRSFFFGTMGSFRSFSGKNDRSTRNAPSPVRRTTSRYWITSTIYPSKPYVPRGNFCFMTALLSIKPNTPP